MQDNLICSRYPYLVYNWIDIIGSFEALPFLWHFEVKEFALLIV